MYNRVTVFSKLGKEILTFTNVCGGSLWKLTCFFVILVYFVRSDIKAVAATNVFDYSHIYFIGTDAAGKIIEYAKNNSNKGELEAYELTVAGEVAEIGDGYVLLDDSILCRRKADGTVYKIATNDFRMQRCIEFAGIKTGDLVVVNYKGEISPSNEVSGAYSMSRGTLVDGDLAVPE